MKTAIYENYKPTRYEGKGFLRNLNIRLHRDIEGEMWFGVRQDASVLLTDYIMDFKYSLLGNNLHNQIIHEKNLEPVRPHHQ